jgi:hypothetical protein
MEKRYAAGIAPARRTPLRAPAVVAVSSSFAGTAFPQHRRPPCQSGHESNLVAPVVKLLVVYRSMPNQVGGSLDPKDRAADVNAERCRRCGVGADQPVSACISGVRMAVRVTAYSSTRISPEGRRVPGGNERLEMRLMITFSTGA